MYVCSDVEPPHMAEPAFSEEDNNVSSSKKLALTVELTNGTSLYFSKGKDDVPRNAIKTGLSPCGQVYVGVVSHHNEIMPAKIIPAYNLCYYSYGGREYNTRTKTYLVVDDGYSYEWISTKDGETPSNAAIVGMDDREPYYIGRATMDGEKCVGKILKSQKVCLVPKTGKEFQYKKYDILCIKKQPFRHVSLFSE